MAKLTQVHVTALKDTTLETGTRTAKYLDDSMKPAQFKTYEQKHGLTVRAGAEIELDLRDDQLEYVRQAVARGDIEASGLPAPVRGASK